MNNIKTILNTATKPLLYVGCHNALSAYIAQQAGADGLWLSSFELSATYRLPDADILTTSEYSHIINTISDRIKVPLLVDADEGHGNAINVLRVTREYEKNGADGIVIEDNVYPKQCSFYSGKKILEDPKLFCGKLKAAKDSSSADFFIGARTEAFIAGLGIDEAMNRALMYQDVGNADAIIVHSKIDSADEVLQFAEQWSNCGGHIPLVCIPTTYNKIKYDDLYNAGYSLIILANYGIRSIVNALKDVYSTIINGDSLSTGNKFVCPMTDIFDLVFINLLKDNEEKYINEFKK